MINWEKKGLIHTCDIYGTGFAQDAFIDIVNDKIWRIYFSARSQESISYPHYIDVEAGNVKIKIGQSHEPLLDIGQKGSFDDNGITVTSIVKIDCNRKYIYYCGWNKKTSVPYSLSIGCAEVINDKEYRKISDGPLIERSINNPIAVSAPFVIKDGEIFRMWYISFQSWDSFEGRLEPIYVVKHATSQDGINWQTDSKICINSEYYGESIGRPWVIKDEGIFKMWFSIRGIKNYRLKSGQHYMIGYAESIDGINWERRQDKFIFEKSESGWDSEMLEYASVIKFNNKYTMLYNGNQFGKTGFGYAELKI